LAYQDRRILAVGADAAPRFEAYREGLNKRNALLSAIVQAEQLVLATDALTYFAHWITPEGLSLVVFFHELGHFLTGRWCGVKVDAFSLGFGPEIFGFDDRYGTHWRLAAFPLGGY